MHKSAIAMHSFLQWGCAAVPQEYDVNSAINIGICAPSRAITRNMAQAVTDYAAAHFPRAVLHFHDQCFAAHGHFAGDDTQRRDAFVEMANNPALDALWFARGGYGAARIAGDIIAGLNETARGKIYMGYSDGGNLLGALYDAGIGQVCHGPMVADINRDGGEAAIGRALGWLCEGQADALDASLGAAIFDGAPVAAFNLMTLAMMAGTPLMPDLAGHVLMLEEIDEHHYAIDRAMFHITSHLADKGLAGISMGRFSGIPQNTIDFGMSAEEIVRYWCERSGIAWAGHCDIGHDADNKVVPFGRL
jgi:muramoyltetrapeptide carboxypeptidase